MRNAKWLVLVLAGCLLAPAAMGAALVTEGSNEIAVGGALDFASAAGVALDVRVKYAYFFWDRISLGTRASLSDNDVADHFGLGFLGEYNFALPEGYEPLFGTDLVPFVGAAVDYRHVKLFRESEDAIVFGVEGGTKFFLTDSAAISLSLVGELATEEIYADDLDATDKDLSLRLGMRFYF